MAGFASWSLTKQVNVLVHGIALDGGPALLEDELLAEVGDVALLCTNLESFLLGGLEVLELADVSHEADYVVALLEKPFENDGGVETPGIGETDGLLGHCEFVRWDSAYR